MKATVTEVYTLTLTQDELYTIQRALKRCIKGKKEVNRAKELAVDIGYVTEMALNAENNSCEIDKD